MSDEDNHHDSLLFMTTEIVSAHVANNKTEADEIPTVIQKVYKALVGLHKTTVLVADRPKPVVPIKDSITDSIDWVAFGRCPNSSVNVYRE